MKKNRLNVERMRKYRHKTPPPEKLKFTLDEGLLIRQGEEFYAKALEEIIWPWLLAWKQFDSTVTSYTLESDKGFLGEEIRYVATIKRYDPLAFIDNIITPQQARVRLGFKEQ